jgi:outer membrane protein TolC
MSPTPPRGLTILPINLPTAFKLAGAQALDIALASERITVAAAQLQASRALWLPTLFTGTDYFATTASFKISPGMSSAPANNCFKGASGPR